MTTQKAIEQFKERLLITDYREQIPEYYEAIETAIEALEKQIPKKPIDNEECKWFECPTCGMIVARYYNGTAHHCECGQAIDWSDEE